MVQCVFVGHADGAVHKTKEEADEFDVFLKESRAVNPKDWE